MNLALCNVLVIFTAFNTNLGIYDKQYQTLRN